MVGRGRLHPRLGLLVLSLLIGVLLPMASKAEQSEIEAWQAFLSQQTELVTRTKLNADFVPGAITVLHGDDLVHYGVRTLADALALAPNIDMQLNLSGQQVIVMRGVGAGFSGSSVKLTLDGVNSLHASQGFAQTLLHMPIEQIERIEIIRGASTLLHGEEAIAGVVNVVSQKRSQFQLATGSFGYRAASLSQTKAWKSSEFRVNLSQWQQDATTTQVKQDAMTQFSAAVDALELVPPGLFAGYSAAPGPINNQRAFDQIQIGWQHHQTQLNFAYNRLRTGDFFGVIELLPPPNKHYAQNYEDYLLSFQHEAQLTPKLTSLTQFSLSQFSYRLATLYVPYDIPDEIASNFPALEDFATRQNYVNRVNERHAQFEQHFIYAIHPQHRLMFGLDFHWLEITDADALGILNGDSRLKENLASSFASSGDSRYRLALMLQDEWQLHPDVRLTLGLRASKTQTFYQDRSPNADLGYLANPWHALEDWQVTPKIAGVWQLDNHNIIKAQFSQSHIAPPINFVTYIGDVKPGDRLPESAKTDHYELGYIYVGARHTQRLSVYQSDYQRLALGTGYFYYFTGLEQAAEFGQEDYPGLTELQARGIEWDSDFKLSRSLRGFASLSFNQPRDKLDYAVLGSRPYLGRLGLHYDYNGQLGLAINLSHGAKVALEPYDSRKELPAYWVWTMAANYRFANSGWHARLMVNNLTHQTQASPSPINRDLSLLNRQATAPYPEGYPGEGRRATLSVAYQF